MILFPSKIASWFLYIIHGPRNPDVIQFPEVSLLLNLCFVIMFLWILFHVAHYSTVRAYIATDKRQHDSGTPFDGDQHDVSSFRLFRHQESEEEDSAEESQHVRPYVLDDVVPDAELIISDSGNTAGHTSTSLVQVSSAGAVTATEPSLVSLRGKNDISAMAGGEGKPYHLRTRDALKFCFDQ